MGVWVTWLLSSLSAFPCFPLLSSFLPGCFTTTLLLLLLSFHFLFSPCSFLPVPLCSFLAFSFLLTIFIYFSFSFLVASRRGFSDSLSLAFSAWKVFLFFSLFNSLTSIHSFLYSTEHFTACGVSSLPRPHATHPQSYPCLFRNGLVPFSPISTAPSRTR